jgi:hypothetical protein
VEREREGELVREVLAVKEPEVLEEAVGLGLVLGHSVAEGQRLGLSVLLVLAEMVKDCVGEALVVRVLLGELELHTELERDSVTVLL